MFVGDLIAAALVMASISLLAGFWASSAKRASTNWTLVAILLLSVASVVLQLRFANKLMWAHLIPHFDALVWCNFTPLLLAVAAGFAYRAARGKKVGVSRFLVVLLAVVAALAWLAPLARPFIRPLAELGDPQWSHEVLLQTHESSCAPAAAVTLLHQHGLNYTERQLVDLCMSSNDGTTGLGLYRGLKLATDNSDLTVTIFEGDLEKLRQRAFYPAIALVTIPSEQQAWSDGLSLIAGRKPGEGHAIVVFGPSSKKGFWDIGDPASGRAIRSQKYLATIWNGEAICLTSKTLR